MNVNLAARSIEGATTGYSKAMAQRWATAPRLRAAALMLLAAAVLFTPVIVELARTPNWLLHPSWNGSGYSLGAHGVIPAVLDPTGSAAVLATLDLWRGGGASEAEVFALLSERAFDYRLASFAVAAEEAGFPGRWALVDVGALAQLPTPFLAHLNDAGGRFVIVLRVASGYAYVADPNVGTALMPLADFARLSSQQVFVFDDDVPTPGGW